MSYYAEYHGWYQTDAACLVCGSNILVQDDYLLWRCEVGGCERTGAPISPHFIKWAKEYAWREKCKEAVDRLDRLNAERLLSHPLDISACRKCGEDGPWRAMAKKARNGVLVAMVFCGACGYSNPPHPLKREQLDPNGLPMEIACDSCGDEGCAECGQKCGYKPCDNYLTERHHYFPQSIARDVGTNPWDWPVAPLCPEHHNFWHRHVTPQIYMKDLTQ